jgi:hypothetical protein
MRISPVRLPRLLGVVVLAFAPYEARPLLGAVGLIPGIGIQVAYRWATDQVMADRNNRAVLLWSIAFRQGERRAISREALGVLAAVTTGIALVVVTNAIVLLPLRIGLVAAGVSENVIIDVIIGIIGARLLVTSWRALRAYRGETALSERLPTPSTTRWRIDFLAAVPAGGGYGSRLLDSFLDRADKRNVEVVLHCETRNVGFYRRHGFHLVATEAPNGQRLMLRPAQAPRARIKPGRMHRLPRHLAR